MKQRLFTFTACLFVLLITLTSCNKTKDDDEDILIYPSFRLGLQQGEGTIEYRTAELFAQKVEELSEGTINIKIFPDGILGDDIEMIKGVMNGTLDITYTETGRLGLWVNEAKIFGYPFAFDDYDHLLRTLNSDYGKHLHELFKEHNITVLANGYNGTRETTSNKPIKTIDDMKGLHFRVPKSVSNLKFAELSGAKPEIVPFNEVYRQLKGGLIDAQENPLPTIFANNFYEVQTCVAITSHIINDNNLIISTSSYDLLQDWQKDAIKEAAKEAEKYLSESFRTEERQILKFFHDRGMIITLPDREPFRQACLPLYYDYIQRFGDEAYNAIQNAREEK